MGIGRIGARGRCADHAPTLARDVPVEARVVRAFALMARRPMQGALDDSADKTR